MNKIYWFSQTEKEAISAVIANLNDKYSKQISTPDRARYGVYHVSLSRAVALSRALLRTKLGPITRSNDYVLSPFCGQGILLLASYIQNILNHVQFGTDLVPASQFIGIDNRSIALKFRVSAHEVQKFFNVNDKTDFTFIEDDPFRVDWQKVTNFASHNHVYAICNPDFIAKAFVSDDYIKEVTQKYYDDKAHDYVTEVVKVPYNAACNGYTSSLNMPGYSAYRDYNITQATMLRLANMSNFARAMVITGYNNFEGKVADKLLQDLICMKRRDARKPLNVLVRLSNPISATDSECPCPDSNFTQRTALMVKMGKNWYKEFTAYCIQHHTDRYSYEAFYNSHMPDLFNYWRNKTFLNNRLAPGIRCYESLPPKESPISATQSDEYNLVGYSRSHPNGVFCKSPYVFDHPIYQVGREVGKGLYELPDTDGKYILAKRADILHNPDAATIKLVQSRYFRIWSDYVEVSVVPGTTDKCSTSRSFSSWPLSSDFDIDALEDLDDDQVLRYLIKKYNELPLKA